MSENHVLREKIYTGERITSVDAVKLFSWDILELGMAADHRRKLVTPGEEVGFIIDRIINFTNICQATVHSALSMPVQDSSNPMNSPWRTSWSR